jgi:hypothetical protein
MGHNMQREWWTYDATVEVTVNIFSLKATQITVGVSPKDTYWLKDQKANGLEYLKNPDYSVWSKDPGIALLIYAQVIEDYGWDVMGKVLKSYEVGDSSTYPKDDQGKIDLFWSKYS